MASTSSDATADVSTKLKKVIKKVQSSAAGATHASNALPKIGGDFEVYNTNKSFAQLMAVEKGRLNELMCAALATAGIPRRLIVRLQQGDIRDQLEALTNVNDKLFERVANSLDEADGLRKKEHQIVVAGTQRQLKSSTWQAYKEGLEGPKEGEEEEEMTPATAQNPLMLASQANGVTHVDNSLPKPQDVYDFGDFVDNADTPFKHDKLVVKHNAIPDDRLDESRYGKSIGVTIVDESMNCSANDSMESAGSELGGRQWASDRLNVDRYEHPYARELTTFLPTDAQLTTVTPRQPADLVGHVYVDTEQKLRDLVNVLNGETAFAVDLEHHSERSYLGITCLIQISTRTQDYIVDPFPIWRHLHALNDPMTNPDIVKVLHGADSDVLWLQRDFGVYVVNMFDTYRAMRHLQYGKHSLQFLVDKLLNVQLDKGQTQSDWRRRPLSADQSAYAQLDTHYLLYCFDVLTNELLAVSNESLVDVYARSRDVSASIYTKPKTPFNAYSTVERLLAKSPVHSLGAREHYCARMLAQWRDVTAREKDESWHYVLPDRMLIDLANVLPREQTGVSTCCSPMPPLLLDQVVDVHALIIKARDASEEHLASLADADRHLADQQRRARHMPSSRARALAWLYTPLDFSHTRRDEELIAVNGDDGQVIDAPQLIATSTLGSIFAADAPSKGKRRRKDQSKVQHVVLRTYDDQSAVVKKSMTDFQSQFEEMRANTCTPFEQYQLAMMQLEEMNKKSARSTESATSTPITPKSVGRRFTHHDPSTGIGAKQQGSTVDEPEDQGEYTGKFAYDAQELLTAKGKLKARQHMNANLAEEDVRMKGSKGGKKRKMPAHQGEATLQPFDYASFAKSAAPTSSSTSASKEAIFDPDRDRPKKKFKKVRKPMKSKGKSAIWD